MESINGSSHVLLDETLNIVLPAQQEEITATSDNSAMAKHNFIHGYIPAMGDVEACPTCGGIRVVLRQ